MAKDAHPARRTLRLPKTGRDFMSGPDIPPLQREAGQRLVERGEKDDIGPHDGIYGVTSASGVSRAVFRCGGARVTVRASQVKRGGKVSVRTQNFLRHPATRPKTWLVREKARNRAWRRQQAKAAKSARKVTEPRATVRRSPNQSSRGGVKPSIIVLHTTEGAYAGAVSWLQNPQAQASSHLVISARGDTTRLVDDSAKAWTQADFNPQALSIEQEGYASQTSWPDAQLREVAKWIAYWSQRHGIPIKHSTSHGVCQHKDLGAAGGGHWDCGPSYPEARVLRLARRYAKRGWS